MITTNKTRITSKDLFKALVTITLRKSWWAYGLVGLLIFLIAFHKEKDSSEVFIIYLFIGILIGKMLKSWFAAYSKDNKLFLLEKYIEISKDKIIEVLNDGTNCLIKIEHFIKVIQTKKFYFLYYTKDQYIVIAKDSFKTKEDFEWFDEEIVRKLENKNNPALIASE